jgi:hypothetical protein
MASFAAPAFVEQPIKKNGVAAMGTRIWLVFLALLLVPALAAWVVRLIGFAFSCSPEASDCLSQPFDGMMGAALKGTLDLAWLVSINTVVMLGLALIASIAAIIALRPVSAAATMLLAPLASLVLPKLLVNATAYNGCAVNVDGLGDCKVWGEGMGMAFHHAAFARQLFYAETPIVVAGALVVGLLGWIVLLGSRKMKKRR